MREAAGRWARASAHGEDRACYRRCPPPSSFSLFSFFLPYRAVYGTDYTGATCGQGARASLPVITYPRLQTDFFLNLAASSPLDYKFYGICLPSCPGTLQVVCNYNAASASQAVMLDCFNGGSSALCTNITASCWVTPIATSPTFFRCVPVYNTTNAAASVCIFPTNIQSAADPACVLATTTKLGVTTAPAQTNQLFDLMSTSRSVAGRWFGDLVRAWWVLLVCAILTPLVLAFLWLLLAKTCTAVFVWGTVALLLAVLTALTVYLYYVRGQRICAHTGLRVMLVVASPLHCPPPPLSPQHTHTPQLGGLISNYVPASIQSEVNVFTTSVSGAINTVTYFVPQSFSVSVSPQTYAIVAYVFTGITIIVLCIIIALRGAINTAIKAIELGAEALQDVPSLIMCVFAQEALGVGGEVCVGGGGGASQPSPLPHFSLLPPAASP